MKEIVEQVAVARGGAEQIGSDRGNTESERHLVESSRDWIHEKCVTLGVDASRELLDEAKTHFLDAEDFRTVRPDGELDGKEGMFVPKTGEVYVLRDADEVKTANRLLHEALHAFSFLKNKTEGLSQSGYLQVDEKHKRDSFRGLTEALVERLRAIIAEQRFSERFGAYDDKIYADSDIRTEDLEVLETIVEKVSKHTGIAHSELWHQLEQGLFTGERRELARLINETFGEDGFTILGLLGSLNWGSDTPATEAQQIDLNALVSVYFEEESLEGRERLARKIYVLVGF